MSRAVEINKEAILKVAESQRMSISDIRNAIWISDLYRREVYSIGKEIEDYVSTRAGDNPIKRMAYSFLGRIARKSSRDIEAIDLVVKRIVDLPGCVTGMSGFHFSHMRMSRGTLACLLIDSVDNDDSLTFLSNYKLFADENLPHGVVMGVENGVDKFIWNIYMTREMYIPKDDIAHDDN